VFPEYNWLPWKFEKASNGYWGTFQNQRKFIDWAGKQLKIKEMSDWYNVSAKVTETSRKIPINFFQSFMGIGGTTLLANKYSGSMTQMLSKLYPEREWLPWKFKKQSRYIWTEKTKRDFMDWAGKQLNVKEKSDWYKVTITEIINLGGKRALVDKNNNLSLSRLLTVAYPEEKWEFSKLHNVHVKKVQNLLKTMLNTMFPKEGGSLRL
jgi:hypothetical protein